jgi:hypothetical protein
MTLPILFITPRFLCSLRRKEQYDADNVDAVGFDDADDTTNANDDDADADNYDDKHDADNGSNQTDNSDYIAGRNGRIVTKRYGKNVLRVYQSTNGLITGHELFYNLRVHEQMVRPSNVKTIFGIRQRNP